MWPRSGQKVEGKLFRQCRKGGCTSSRETAAEGSRYMGIYVNPGNTAFEMARFSDIYVDKSMLIARVSKAYRTEQRFICVSRPRRFGKSMAANMLAAYYSRGCDSAELFSGLEIEQDGSYREHLNQHNVIRLDIQQFLESRRDLDTFIRQIEDAVVEELMEEFPDCRGFGPGSRLKVALNKIFNQTKTGFIFILDVKKYGEHSAINIFEEFSMLDSADLAGFFGFTRTEVQKLCSQKGIDFPEMEKWYDGYVLNGMHIYNPKSVTDVMRRGQFQSYWTGTETYEALKVYIDLNFDGLKEAVIGMLGNVPCRIDPSTSQNDMTTFKTKDDVLTLLVHLGYLAYDRTAGNVFIPNLEITQEYLRAVKVGGWDGLIQSLERSEDLLKSTWAMDGEAVAKGVAAIHSETASILKYNNENSLTCTILMAYYSAKACYMNPVLELPSGKGYADVVYLPKRNVDKPALLVELKWNRSAQGAIAQIREKKYASWVENYTGEILLVGISYDEEKGHACVIEKHIL